MPYFPAEDEKLRAVQHTRRRGGNIANTLEVLHQLIAVETPLRQLKLISVLPSSSSAAYAEIRSSLDESIDFSGCITREDHNDVPSSFIIKSLATGSRTIVNTNSLPEMTTREFEEKATEMLGDEGIDRSLVNEHTLYHFEGRIPDTTLQCIRLLRKNHPLVKVSVEVEKPNRPGLRELAAEADIVFYSKSWAEAQGYKTAIDCLTGEAVDRNLPG